MMSVWFHRCVLCLFVSTLALMTISGFIVSASTGLATPAWAGFGQAEHRILAGLVLGFAVVSLGLAVRLDSTPALRYLSVGVVAAILVQAAMGMAMSSIGRSVWLGMAQATLMHLVFTAVTVLLLLSSSSWKQPAVLVEDEFRPSLRSMAWLPAILIVAQVGLGSAYRHGVVGVLPHLVGALLVAGLLALVGLLVATTYPNHQPLRQSAMAVVWLMLAQVVLGVLALSYRAGTGGSGAVWDANFVLFTVGHLLLGSMTLASCVWLAMTIRKQVNDAVAAPVASASRETV